MWAIHLDDDEDGNESCVGDSCADEYEEEEVAIRQTVYPVDIFDDRMSQYDWIENATVSILENSSQLTFQDWQRDDSLFESVTRFSRNVSSSPPLPYDIASSAPPPYDICLGGGFRGIGGGDDIAGNGAYTFVFFCIIHFVLSFLVRRG